MGYKKINDYEIYNPNVAPLKKDDALARVISQYADNYKIIYPELYKFFQHKDAYDFFKKDIKINYLSSVFNENTKAPTDDYFRIFFDDYQVDVHRKLAKNSELPYYLYAYDLKKVK